MAVVFLTRPTLLFWLSSSISAIDTVDDLVEFPAIKPYAAACWTVIYLYSLPFGYLKWVLINRTFHKRMPVSSLMRFR